MDPALAELLFTTAACVALLVLFLASAAVLPWTEAELDEVEQGLRKFSEVTLGEAMIRPQPAATRSRAA